MRDFKDKRRIVVKIGSSSLFHTETGKPDLIKLDKLIRIISDHKNQGKDMILVSSGAISAGLNKLGLDKNSLDTPKRQACASVGQAELIGIYQKIFSEYNNTASQILVTRYTFHNSHTRTNAANTFEELLKLGVIPVVNENDTVTTEEIEFGDNDCLSALVAKLTKADLLILLSDIDGFYSDDPRRNPEAEKFDVIETIDEDIINMAKKTPGSQYGSGGMASKIEAAQIATGSKIDMVIANADNIDNLNDIIKGEEIGTLFKAQKEEAYFFEEFDIKE